MTFATAPPLALVVPVLTLSSDLPLGAGLTLTQLLQLMDHAGCGGPPGQTGLGPAPARAVLTSLATSATRMPSDEVGLAILGPLRALDEVAYLRFASVYQAFSSAEDFEKAIVDLRAEHRAQDP